MCHCEGTAFGSTQSEDTAVSDEAPDGMTLGNRIALTIVIVLVILFAIAAFGYFTGGWEVQ